MRQIPVLTVLCVALVGIPGSGTTPQPERVWGPAVQAIQRAAFVKEPAGREQALREAIRDALLSPDGAIRQETFEYL